MATDSAKNRARSELARLTTAQLDNDAFRWEAAAILRRAIGVDGWHWILTDPGSQLPTRDIGENLIPIRSYCRRHPEAAWDRSEDPSARQPVTVLSAVTAGDLARYPPWRETFGPARVGDYLKAPLTADGTCWAQLRFWRDSSGKFFSANDAGFVAAVAPMLAARIRDGLRLPAHYKAIFGKTGVSRRQDLVATLAGDARQPRTDDDK